MHARRARLIGLACAVILLGSCDTNAVGPGPDDPSLSASPGDPINLTATATSHRQIRLAWQDMSTREAGFELYRSTSGGSGPFGLLITTGPNVSVADDGTVTAETRYCYQVRSFRITGGKTHYSSFSASACATTPVRPLLPAPIGLTARPVGSNAVQVSWTDNSQNETGFRLERSTDAGATWVVATSTPYAGFHDAGRTSDQEVCYQVIAVNSLGDYGDSPPSEMRCTAPPARPTNLTATTAPGFAIQLAWTGSTVADGYEVWERYQYCYPGGYYGYEYCYYYDVSVTVTAATSFLHENLGPGEYHSYYVVALNDGGQSDQSDMASAWSNAAPAVPSNLTATAVSPTQIDLAWADASSDEANFVIQRCTGDIAACTDESFGGIDAAPGANATTFSDTGVEPGTTYTYRILSCNNRCSAPSNKAAATTPP